MTDYFNLVDNEYLYLFDYNQVINAGIKELFLEHGQNRKLPVTDVVMDEDFLKAKLRELPQLILETTENCNLRCKYCIYNDNYINQRSMSNDSLSLETARKGIDYVYTIIKDRLKKEFSIGFYGGEPLLNFRTLKEVVKYAEKKFSDWILRLNMTTNLTLLDDDMLDFILEHNISLLVSLDGDRGNHDAKRVFANGKGSHDIIMKNLERIKNRDEQFYNDKVGFSAVYSYDLPLKNLHRFFTSHPLIKDKRMRFSNVNTYDTTYYNEYPCDKNASRKDLGEIYGILLQKVNDGIELTGYEDFLFKAFKNTEERLRARNASTLGGTCLFDSRLYIDCHGNFHACEKINNQFGIGDVEKGLDFPRMLAYIKEFQEVIKTYCSNCEVRFLCSRCFVVLAGDGRFKINPEYCEDQKKSAPRMLEHYIKCKEEQLL